MKARMKAITLCIVVSLVCSALLFAGGAKESVSSDRPEVNILMWGGADRLNYFRTIYEANTALTPENMANVTFTSGGKNAVDCYQLFRLSLSANDNIPGIVMFGSETAATEFILNGDLMDISSQIQALQDDILPAAMDLCSNDGKVYGVPTQVKSKVWYYRTDLFEKAGIDVAAIKTFEDFYEAGMKFKKAFPDKYFINMGGTPNIDVLLGWLASYDGLKISNEDGTYNVSSDPRFRDMFEKIYALAHADFSMYISDWDADWQPAIESGKVASLLSWSWMTEFLPKYAPDQKGLWAMTSWPEEFMKGGSAEVVSIPVKAKNTSAAFEVLDTLFLKENSALARFNENGLLPITYSGVEKVRSSAAVARKPAEVSQEDWNLKPINFFGLEMVDSIWQTMQHANKFESDPSFNAESAILLNHIMMLIAGSETLDEAITNAQKDLEIQIGNPYDI